LYPTLAAALNPCSANKRRIQESDLPIEIVIASSMLAERQASYTNPKKQDNRAEACNSTANAAR
jgi:hypothetical protein